MHVSQLGRSARLAKPAMDRSQVSVSSFGLINRPLGEVAHSLSVRARTLTGTLADTATQLAQATSILRREWELAEQQAEETSAKLAKLLEDV